MSMMGMGICRCGHNKETNLCTMQSTDKNVFELLTPLYWFDGDLLVYRFGHH